MSLRMQRVRTLILTVCHFVCPLLFFTDLTRNPYYTQIAVLNPRKGILRGRASLMAPRIGDKKNINPMEKESTTVYTVSAIPAPDWARTQKGKKAEIIPMEKIVLARS